MQTVSLRLFKVLMTGLLLNGCAAFAAYAADAADVANLTERQAQLLANNCVQCHARAQIGAPIMGNAADWKERSRQGEEKMLMNVVAGLRGMPPLGYCSACNEQDFRAMIRFMAKLDVSKGTAK